MKTIDGLRTKWLTDAETEAVLQGIEEDFQSHNESIGADERPPAELRSDANLFLLTLQGISTTTLCMMATDHHFAGLRYRAAVQTALDCLARSEIALATEVLKKSLLNADGAKGTP